MPSYNRVTLIGRLGRDPDVRTSGEQPMARFSLATDRPGARDKQAEPDWHHVVCWGQLADFAARYLRTGRLILVSGRLSYRAWETADGKTVHAAEVVASELTALDRPPESGADVLEAAGDDLPY